MGKDSKPKAATAASAGGSHAKDRHKKAARHQNSRWAAAASFPGIVPDARLPVHIPKAKHISYYELVENKDKKKKKLEFQVTTEREPPPGLEFVPVGNPDLTKACKELSREQEAMVLIVSNAKENDENGFRMHVNRIGHHVRKTIVDQARALLGNSMNRQVNPNDLGRPEPIPKSQEEINAQADAYIRDLFPRMPNTDRQTIIEHSFRKGQPGRHGEPPVGLASDIPLSRRVQLAVVAHIRHTHTRYDQLIRETNWHIARKAVEPICLEVLVKWRGDEETGRDQIDEYLREVIVISDDETGDDDSDDDDDSDSDESSELEFISRHHAPVAGASILRQHERRQSAMPPATRVPTISYLADGAEARPLSQFRDPHPRHSPGRFPDHQAPAAELPRQRGLRRYAAQAREERWKEARERVHHDNLHAGLPPSLSAPAPRRELVSAGPLPPSPHRKPSSPTRGASRPQGTRQVYDLDGRLLEIRSDQSLLQHRASPPRHARGLLVPAQSAEPAYGHSHVQVMSRHGMVLAPGPGSIGASHPTRPSQHFHSQDTVMPSIEPRSPETERPHRPLSIVSNRTPAHPAVVNRRSASPYHSRLHPSAPNGHIYLRDRVAPGAPLQTGSPDASNVEREYPAHAAGRSGTRVVDVPGSSPQGSHRDSGDHRRFGQAPYHNGGLAETRSEYQPRPQLKTAPRVLLTGNPDSHLLRTESRPIVVEDWDSIAGSRHHPLMIHDWELGPHRTEARTWYRETVHHQPRPGGGAFETFAPTPNRPVGHAAPSRPTQYIPPIREGDHQSQKLHEEAPRRIIQAPFQDPYPRMLAEPGAGPQDRRPVTHYQPRLGLDNAVFEGRAFSRAPDPDVRPQPSLFQPPPPRRPSQDLHSQMVPRQIYY